MANCKNWALTISASQERECANNRGALNQETLGCS